VRSGSASGLGQRSPSFLGKKGTGDPLRCEGFPLQTLSSLAKTQWPYRRGGRAQDVCVGQVDPAFSFKASPTLGIVPESFPPSLFWQVRPYPSWRATAVTGLDKGENLAQVVPFLRRFGVFLLSSSFSGFTLPCVVLNIAGQSRNRGGILALIGCWQAPLPAPLPRRMLVLGASLSCLVSRLSRRVRSAASTSSLS